MTTGQRPLDKSKFYDFSEQYKLKANALRLQAEILSTVIHMAV